MGPPRTSKISNEKQRLFSDTLVKAQFKCKHFDSAPVEIHCNDFFWHLYIEYLSIYFCESLCTSNVSGIFMTTRNIGVERNSCTKPDNETTVVWGKLEHENHCLQLLENTTNQPSSKVRVPASFYLVCRKVKHSCWKRFLNILFINANAVKM